MTCSRLGRLPIADAARAQNALSKAVLVGTESLNYLSILPRSLQIKLAARFESCGEWQRLCAASPRGAGEQPAGCASRWCGQQRGACNLGGTGWLTHQSICQWHDCMSGSSNSSTQIQTEAKKRACLATAAPPLRMPLRQDLIPLANLHTARSQEGQMNNLGVCFNGISNTTAFQNRDDREERRRR